MRYELEWLYSDLKPGENPPNPNAFDIHFCFLLRFNHIPPGNGHVAHFCFNVLSVNGVSEQDVSRKIRGHLFRDSFSYAEITESVEAVVEQAFLNETHERALEFLNTKYIHTDIDFSGEFKKDLAEPGFIIDLIHTAFDGVERGHGITLHQALVIGDYGGEEEQIEARELDNDLRWQEVPENDIASNLQYLCFLDAEGYRYYLPANMSWAIKNYMDDPEDSAFFTYLSLLPTVAPREVGRGLGERFSVQEFIRFYSFSKEQVRAIYYFLCFMAIKAELEIDEDQYPAVSKWKEAAAELETPSSPSL